MAQELIARMLGVRHEGVTEAAGRLEKAGLIRYRRGHINRAQSIGDRATDLRVLCRDQERIRSLAARDNGGLDSSIADQYVY